MKYFAILCCVIVTLVETIILSKAEHILPILFPFKEMRRIYLHREANNEMMNSKVLLLTKMGRWDSKLDLRNKCTFMNSICMYQVKATLARFPKAGSYLQIVSFLEYQWESGQMIVSMEEVVLLPQKLCSFPQI